MKIFQKIDLYFLENKQEELILKRVILFKFLFVLPVLQLSLLCFYFLKLYTHRDISVE
jgi:hypothetical protein